MLDRVAFSTNAYTNGRWTLESAIKRITKEGYSGVSILVDQPLLWLPDFIGSNDYIRLIASLNQLFVETSVTISSVNGFTTAGYYGKRKTAPGQQFGPSFSDEDKELRDYKIWYTKRVIDFAACFGCPDVSFGSGYLPKGVERERAWEWMRDAIAQAVSYGEIRGVNLNLEYEPKLLVGGADDAARLLEEIPSPNLGLHFDIGHSFVCGENVVEEIYRFGDKINGVDFEDIPIDTSFKPIHAHMVPGEGKMPLKRILRAFNDIGYDGWFTIELYNHYRRPVEVMKKSMKAMRKILREMEEEDLKKKIKN